MLKKVLLNTASQIVAKGFTATSTLIVTVLIGRALGETGYGQFTKIFVFIGYFYTLVDFGLNSIYVRETDKQNEIRLFRVLFGLRVILSVLFVLTSIVFTLILPYDPQAETGFSPLVKIGIVLASTTIFTQAIFTTANAYFQRNLKYYFSTLASVTSALIVLALSVTFFLQGAGVLSYTLAYVLSGAGLALVAIYLLKKVAKENIFPTFAKKESISLLRHAWPIGLSLIFNIVYFRVDVFILTNFRSTQEVGIYGLAYQFFEASLAIPIFFANSIYPVLTNSYKKDIKDFQKNLKFWLVALLITSLALSLFLFLASFIIPLIYQGKFQGSTKALQILSLGIPFFFLSALLWHVFIIYNRQKVLIAIYLSGAIFNIIANLIFIPQKGYIAAAIITVIAEALIFFLMSAYLLFQNDTRISIRSKSTLK